MNNKIVLGILLALVVAASGCTAQQQNPEKETVSKTELPNGGEIRKVTMENGMVSCYIYREPIVEGGMGGMSCNYDKTAGK